jgi:two-component system chemotaxis sensor kinase CheA
VEQISATIQELCDIADQNTSAGGRRSRQLIDSLFRTVHSFKAAASAEGLNDLSRTAHEFENVLHSLRTGELTLDAELLRVFDDTATALRDSAPASALSSLKERTDRHMADTHERLPAELADLKAEERQRAIAALREGANLFVMNVEFDVSDFDERYRQLKERLEESAELIATSAAMNDDKIIFQVVYASESEKIPIRTILRQAVRAGTQAATQLGKQVDFVVSSEEFLLEKRWSDVLSDALLHLVRNAVDHGIDSCGKVVLQVTTSDTEMQIAVTDDGRGIAPDSLPLVFQPGFSTAAEVTELSGRGVGLDVVKAAIEESGGSVSVTSEPNKGTSFKITGPGKITRPDPSSDA